MYVGIGFFGELGEDNVRLLYTHFSEKPLTAIIINELPAFTAITFKATLTRKDKPSSRCHAFMLQPQIQLLPCDAEASARFNAAA